MKILIVHNRYRPTAPSGENAVVDQESSALLTRGHEVALFQRHSEEIADWSPLRRATLPARVLWSEDSRRGITKSLSEFRAGCRPRPQHLSFGDAVGPVRLPRRLGPCRRDRAQLQAGLCERNVLPRRPGLPRLLGRILCSRAGSRLLPRLGRVDGPRRARFLAAPHGVADHDHRLHLHLRCSTGSARPGRASRRPQLRQAQLRAGTAARTPRSPPSHRSPMWGVWTRRRAHRFSCGPGMPSAPTSALAAAPRGCRWGRNVGGGGQLGRRPYVRDDGRSRLAPRGVSASWPGPAPWSFRRSGRRPSAWLRSRPWPPERLP